MSLSRRKLPPSSQSSIGTRSSIAFSNSVAGSSFAPPESQRSQPEARAVSLKDVLAELLSVSYVAEERSITLQRARKVLGHGNKVRHNEELMVHNVAAILYMKLAFAVSTRASSDEIRRICELLELVTVTADMHAVENSFDDVGRECLPLLTTVLELPFMRESDPGGRKSTTEIRVVSSKAVDDREKLRQRVGWNSSHDQKMTVQHVCKLLAKYSFLDDSTHCMAIQPNLLPSLIRTMDVSHGMTSKARYSALAILSNLAQMGDSDTRVILSSYPGLLQAVAKMALPQEDPMSRQVASRTLMHLTYGNDDHVPLVHLLHDGVDKPHQAAEISVLDVWINLLRDPDPLVRRYTVFGLYNAACGDENTLSMVAHKGGTLLDSLIITASLEEEDPEIRILALETIYNLSCSSLFQVHKAIGSHPGLLMAIASFLRFRERAPLPTKETSACILHRMSQVLTLEHTPECQQSLFSALVLGSLWTQTPDVAIAFDLQATDNPEGMCKHSGLLDGLSAQALTVGEIENCWQVRAAAISAIVRLANAQSNQELLANHEGIMLALTRASFDHNPYNTLNSYPFQSFEEREAFSRQLNQITSTLKELVFVMSAPKLFGDDALSISEEEFPQRKLLLLTQYPFNDPV